MVIRIRTNLMLLTSSVSTMIIVPAAVRLTLLVSLTDLIHTDGEDDSFCRSNEAYPNSTGLSRIKSKIDIIAD